MDLFQIPGWESTLLLSYRVIWKKKKRPVMKPRQVRDSSHPKQPPFWDLSWLQMLVHTFSRLRERSFLQQGLSDCTRLINSHKQAQCLLGEESALSQRSCIRDVGTWRRPLSLWACRYGPAELSLLHRRPDNERGREHQKAMTHILAPASQRNVSTGVRPPGAFIRTGSCLTSTTGRCPPACSFPPKGFATWPAVGWSPVVPQSPSFRIRIYFGWRVFRFSSCPGEFPHTQVL